MAAASTLWADKHAPRVLADIVGNAATIAALRAWLTVWPDVHLTGTAAPIAKRHPRDNPGARAALLCGPPGVGKTSVAHLLATALGYTVVECNASDDRSAKAVSSALGALTAGEAFHRCTAGRRPLLLVDEVDGLSGAADRGGAAALGALITTSRCPVLCTANDRDVSAVRTLLKHCYDVRFEPPPAPLVVARLSAIATAEGVHVDMNALSAAVAGSRGDVRHLINALQLVAVSARRQAAAVASASASATVAASAPVAVVPSGGQTKAAKKAPRKSVVPPVPVATVFTPPPPVAKDALLSIDYAAATRLLLSDGVPLDTRMDAFFVDTDFVPLAVQEAVLPALARLKDERAALLTAAAALDAAAEGDLLLTRTRATQQWGLLPAAAITFVRTGAAVAAAVSAPPSFIGFPAWLGRNSTRTKRTRLLREARAHMAGRGASIGATEFVLTTWEPVRTLLLAVATCPGAAATAASAGTKRKTPSKRGVPDSASVKAVACTVCGAAACGPAAAAALARRLGLSRDDVLEGMLEVALPASETPEGPIRDMGAALTSTQKAAMTREFNRVKRGGEVKRTSGGGGTAVAVDADRSEDGEGEVCEQEGEDEGGEGVTNEL